MYSSGVPIHCGTCSEQGEYLGRILDIMCVCIFVDD